MKKSNRYTRKQKNIDDVRADLLSGDSLSCIYAIRYCALNNVTDDITINMIKSLKDSDLIEWNSVKVSDCAKAALDLLGVEKYQGKDDPVTDYIDTVFFTNLEN